MNETSKRMNQELFLLSVYRVLILARRCCLAVFGIFFTYGLCYHVFSRPIIYLCLSFLLLPEGVSVLFYGLANWNNHRKQSSETKQSPTLSSKTAKKTQRPQFPTLWKRYGYTPNRLRNLSIGVLLEAALLFLWQFTSAVTFPSSLFTWMPCILGAFLLGTFVFGAPIFFFCLQQKITSGKL